MDFCMYDSRRAEYKTPFGAVKTDETVCFNLYIPVVSTLSAPVITLYRADDWEHPLRLPMEYAGCDNTGVRYTTLFSCKIPHLLFYGFEAKRSDKTVLIRKNPQDTTAVESNEEGWFWQLTVYDKQMETPSCLRGGILYQIFPDRYCNSGQLKENVPGDRMLHQNWYELPVYLPNQQGKITNSDYFGGDLKGIESKLDTIKELGVTAIYLNPIFEAHSNHRYDTADYMKIDPLLGTEKDFESLCRAAKEKGVAIILDGVFNHTGSDSLYFNKNKRYGEHSGAFHDPDSPYRSWYNFRSYPYDYESWWGFETLPNLNETDPAYTEFLCGEAGVLKKWLGLGAAGYRLDVVDELPDSLVDELHRTVRSYDKDACLIGEVWEDASNKTSYGVRRRYLLGNQLDSVMNYPFKDSILHYMRYGGGAQFYHTVLTILENYPKPVIDALMNSLSTHDTERALTILSGEPLGGNGRDWQAGHHHLTPEQYYQGKNLLRPAAVMQYMLPGIPCLYYGDEAGNCGYRDPFNRTTYPWEREDLELRAFFATLGQVRQSLPMLSTARFVPLRFHEETVSFLRQNGEEAVLVAVNRTAFPQRIHLPAQFRDKSALFGSVEQEQLPPYGWVIIKA